MSSLYSFYVFIQLQHQENDAGLGKVKDKTLQRNIE